MVACCFVGQRGQRGRGRKVDGRGRKVLLSELLKKSELHKARKKFFRFFLFRSERPSLLWPTQLLEPCASASAKKNDKRVPVSLSSSHSRALSPRQLTATRLLESQLLLEFSMLQAMNKKEETAALSQFLQLPPPFFTAAAARPLRSHSRPRSREPPSSPPPRLLPPLPLLSPLELRLPGPPPRRSCEEFRRG